MIRKAPSDAAEAESTYDYLIFDVFITDKVTEL